MKHHHTAVSTRATKMPRISCISVLFLSYFMQSNSFSHHIRVCQNKDCMKQFSSSYDGNLIQMLTDLIPSQSQSTSEARSTIDVGGEVTIETSGCLSHCGRGPNVAIHNGSTERVFNDVKDLQTAAAILEVGAELDCPIELMVAVDLITQAGRSKRFVLLLNIGKTILLSHACNLLSIINII